MQEGGGDYNVKGLVSRNRALERDVVAIKVLPPDQWQVITRHIPCILYTHMYPQGEHNMHVTYRLSSAFKQ